jgi:hypothetical protein
MTPTRLKRLSLLEQVGLLDGERIAEAIRQGALSLAARSMIYGAIAPAAVKDLPVAVYQTWRANSGSLVWDGGTQSLTARVLSLSEEQDAALAGINAERRSRCYPGRLTVTLSGLADLALDLRDSDDRQNIAGLGTQAARALQQGSTQSFQFRDADNVQHSLSEAQASELAAAVEAYISTVFEAAWTHKDQIASYGDLSTLSAHDATSGWRSA